ncbi:hypothetical protein HDE_00009 [Halotydeus destructor]|nr:hypothetical protein HDE_00009 [Halotydeus destructor]
MLATMNVQYLELVPSEILVNILNHLPVKDLLAFESTSRGNIYAVNTVFKQKRSLTIQSPSYWKSPEPKTGIRGILVRCSQLRSFRLETERPGERCERAAKSVFGKDKFRQVIATMCPHLEDPGFTVSSCEDEIDIPARYKSDCRFKKIKLDLYSVDLSKRLLQLCPYVERIDFELASLMDITWFFQNDLKHIKSIEFHISPSYFFNLDIFIDQLSSWARPRKAAQVLKMITLNILFPHFNIAHYDVLSRSLELIHDFILSQQGLDLNVSLSSSLKILLDLYGDSLKPVMKRLKMQDVNALFTSNIYPLIGPDWLRLTSLELSTERSFFKHLADNFPPNLTELCWSQVGIDDYIGDFSLFVSRHGNHMEKLSLTFTGYSYESLVCVAAQCRSVRLLELNFPYVMHPEPQLRCYCLRQLKGLGLKDMIVNQETLVF